MFSLFYSDLLSCDVRRQPQTELLIVFHHVTFFPHGVGVGVGVKGKWCGGGGWG